MKKIFILILGLGIMFMQGVSANATGFHPEFEFNNSFETANSRLATYEPEYIVGTVNKFDGYDYYKFRAEKTGTVWAHLNIHESKASSDIDINIVMYDSSQNILKIDNECVGGYASLGAYVEEGDFVYVRIDHDDGYLGKPYYLAYFIDK